MAQRNGAPAKKAPRAPAKPRKTPLRGSSTAEQQAHNLTVGGSAPPPATTSRRADWQAVERDYRTGKFTLRELEAKHGPSNSTIARRAAREGWSQDLSAAVRQATNAKLIAATVQQECSTAQQSAAETVLAAAEIGKAVILGHRSELRQTRGVAMNLLEELAGSALLAEHQELLAQILAGEGATPADEAQARSTVQRALGMSSRITGIKSLAEAITKLHAAERLAFSLDDGKDKEQPPELAEQLQQFVAQIHETGAGRLPIAKRAAR